MDLLLERERRWDFQKQLASHGKTVLIIKGNIPGRDKQIVEGNFLAVYFLYLLRKNGEEVYFRYGAEGLLFFLLTDIEPRVLKKEMIELENQHPLGRFIDLDVYREREYKREEYCYPPRKCYICNTPAKYCTRSQNHGEKELVEIIKKAVKQFIKNSENKMETWILWATVLELSRIYSYGSVSFSSSGSHNDMDALLFLKSTFAILTKAITLDWKGISFEKQREYGLLLEHTMNEVTGGVNTQKGYIFFLTFLFKFFEERYDEKEGKEYIFSIYPSLMEDFDSKVSFGINAFKRWGFKGARHTLEDGMAYLYSLANEYVVHKDIDYLTLKLMARYDDSTMLKRSNIKSVRWIQGKANEILQGNYTKEQLNQYFVDKNITSGGISDLVNICVLLGCILKEGGRNGN
ncbi:MAG: citrate lyase holo-[acyl-carrier protein] synthase [Tissierellia bacterium]|nr:citrate lyase holo-[acyl-carrier protein] synthase [Tissierellia bacterium]